MFFFVLNVVLSMSKKKNHYLCEDRIEKSVIIVIQSGNPVDGFFFPTLILMMISYDQGHTFSRNDVSGF